MKKSLHGLSLVLITAALFLSATTQAQTWQWARSAGSTGSEMTTATAIDASGNLYAVGWYTSANITFGTITLTNPGIATSDIFLVKYDAAGNVLWAKTFGGADGDLGSGVAVDAAGNVLITGWYTSTSLAFGTYTLNNAAATTSDIFVTKLDPAGNTLWAKSVGGASGERGYGIAVDASNNVFVTGGFGSASINFGSGSLSNAGSPTNDVFVTKYDANGTNLWSKSAGGTNADAGLSAAVDSLGNVYVTGQYTSASINFGTGVLNNASTGTQDLFIVKYNGSGTAAWAVRSGGSLDDFGQSIAVKKTAVYVTGGFSSSSVMFGTTTLTNASAGTNDVLLAKYDNNGNAIWAKKSGGADSEAGNGVALDSMGNVYITGYFSSSSISFGTITVNDFSVGYRDLFVAALDAAGTSLWATEVGSSYDETANAIAVNSTGANIYVGGTFNSGAVGFGTTTLYKGCGDDVFVAKLTGGAVGINELNNQQQISIYPNPSNGKFSVDAEGEIIFYNVLGEVIHSEKLNNTSNVVDLSSQKQGVYTYQLITSGKEKFTGRVVVE